MTKKWIIEQDFRESVTVTHYYEIEADTLADAIAVAASGEVESYHVETHYGGGDMGDPSYVDSHEVVY